MSTVNINLNDELAQTFLLVISILPIFSGFGLNFVILLRLHKVRSINKNYRKLLYLSSFIDLFCILFSFAVYSVENTPTVRYGFTFSLMYAIADFTLFYFDKFLGCGLCLYWKFLMTRYTIPISLYSLKVRV